MSSLGGLEIKQVQEKSPFFNLMIYGESGTGKTVLAGSASVVPQMSPVIYMDMEGGTESLRSTFPDVDVVSVKTAKDMDRFYQALKNDKHPYKTVVLDSESEIQQFFMDDIMQIAVDGNDKMEIDVPSQREWGKNLHALRKHVRQFRDLPMNTIFLALSKDERNDKTGKTKTMPGLSGKMSKEFASLIDVVCYYYLKEVKGEDVPRRLLLTTATETIIAKDRSGNLPLIMDGPTMQSIYALMTKSINKAQLEADVETPAKVIDNTSFATLTA